MSRVLPRHHLTALESETPHPQRTATAARPSGETDKTAEVNQPEGYRPRRAPRNDPLQQFPELSIVPGTAVHRADPEAPVQEPNHIRIEQRTRPIESHQQDGVGDVTTDAGKLQKGSFVVRDAASEIVDECTPQRRQTRAPVQESQRAKQLHDMRWRRLGQGRGIRIPVNESGVDGRHQVGARPLKQQLGDQDLEWVASPSPRVVALMVGEPAADAPAKPNDVGFPQNEARPRLHIGSVGTHVGLLGPA